MAEIQNAYKHLVVRPHSWRKQLYLRGRNMTVGQLVATMRVNKLSPEEAAEDFSLPLAQVQEALAYYEAHSNLVNAELREERRYLQAQGCTVEPPSIRRRSTSQSGRLPPKPVRV